MKQIMPDVYLFEGSRMVNVYLVGPAPALTLIDAGTPGKADAILAELAGAGFAPADVRAIVLTHHHFDHVGSAAELARRTGAAVWAHHAEIPYIEQTATMRLPTRFQRLWTGVMSRLIRVAACPVAHPLQDGDVLAALDGLRVFPAPGHTPGSIALYQPQRQLLFCGDAIFNGGPFGGTGGIQLPPRLATLDIAQATASARKLAELPLASVCFGHGAPILSGAGERLRAALG